jgi:cation:H+ antiporter
VAFVLLLGCAVAIYLSCEWFVNAVEWLGHRLRIGGMAVGTVLAAFGTALPESVVTFVAVVFGTTPEQKDIGVGAALGGPLALSTVAYGVVGVLLLLRHRAARSAGQDVAYDPGDLAKLRRDQVWFVTIFVVKVALGVVAFALKPWLGLLFFAAYAAYFWQELRAGGPAADDDLEPLKMQRGRRSPALWAVLLQTALTLVVIFLASQTFVHQLEVVGPALGLSAAVTALLLSPIATELPEIMNAVIWVRQGKTPLALANISGAMMIQATVPSGLGLLFTPWRFDGPLLWSGVVTMVAIAYLLLLLATGRFRPGPLAATALLYAVFAVGLVPLLA